MLQIIMQYAQGNPGAMTFLMELFEKYLHCSIPIMMKLENCPSIKGTNLYVLWSDLCDKDMEKVCRLCETCPSDILEDACSRQDYSGIELVKSYL